MVKLKDETHADLSKLGRYGDTMDDIVRRLIDFYKRHKDKTG
jgi:hypothetical protein